MRLYSLLMGVVLMSDGTQTTLKPFYFLHYVGANLYGRNGKGYQGFIEEARKIGINRCFRAEMVRGMVWGMPILLGSYDCLSKVRDDAGKVVSKESNTEVFGYFRISSINYSCSPLLRVLIANKLDVRAVVSSKPVRVSRSCGSYTLGGCMVVNNSIKELVDIGEKLAKETGEKIKWFVGGSLVEFFEPKVFPNLAFSRSAVKVEWDESLSTDGGFECDVERVVGMISDYQQHKANERSALARGFDWMEGDKK